MPLYATRTQLSTDTSFLPTTFSSQSTTHSKLHSHLSQHNQVANPQPLTEEVIPASNPHGRRPLKCRHRLVTASHHDERDRMRTRDARGRVLRFVEEGLDEVVKDL